MGLSGHFWGVGGGWIKAITSLHLRAFMLRRIVGVELVGRGIGAISAYLVLLQFREIKRLT